MLPTLSANGWRIEAFNMGGFMVRIATLVTACLLLASVALAADGPIQIGVLEDMSGVYARISGPGSVAAARMAVADFGGTVLGRPVEIISGDHQNKPDVGLALARRWYDSGVPLIIGLGNSSISVGVHQLAHEKGRMDIVTTGGNTLLTGKLCSPTGIAWNTDNYAIATSGLRGLLASGLDTWFFIVGDNVAGKLTFEVASKAVADSGGKVLGSAFHPVGNADFSSFMLTAQASGAKVVALADVGGDAINAVIAANEFGVAPRQTVDAVGIDSVDVEAIGLARSQGLQVALPFYWGLDDATEAWSKRFEALAGETPSQHHPAAYGAVMHYLKAVQAAGTLDAETVDRTMRETPVNDFYTHGATIRADGRLMRPFYQLAVKTEAESKGPHDLLNVLRTIPAAEIFRAPAPEECPLVH